EVRDLAARARPPRLRIAPGRDASGDLAGVVVDDARQDARLALDQRIGRILAVVPGETRLDERLRREDAGVDEIRRRVVPVADVHGARRGDRRRDTAEAL